MLTAFLIHGLLLLQGQTGYPATDTVKELYAQNDLRGKPAPKLEVEQWMSGSEPYLKGKTLVVDFWATWCPPCRETIPELNAIAKKFSKDVVVIGISDEPVETVRDFMTKTQMDYKVAVDPLKHMEKFVGVKGIPHVLVITPDGIVRWQGFPLDKTEPLTGAVIAQIVAASKKGGA